jgi:hypothetical protein
MLTRKSFRLRLPFLLSLLLAGVFRFGFATGLKYPPLATFPPDRFLFVPWQYSPEKGLDYVPYPEPRPTYDEFSLDPFALAPPPREVWMFVPDPAEIGLERQRPLKSYDLGIGYLYFRTTLNLPQGWGRRPAYLYAPDVENWLKVEANGATAPRLRKDSSLYRLNGLLHTGPNSIVLTLCAFYDSYRLKNVRFLSDFGGGRVIFALPTMKPPKPHIESIPPSTAYSLKGMRYPLAKTIPRDRFAFAPWETASAGRGKVIVLPKGTLDRVRGDSYRWLLPPDSDWRPSADPHEIGVPQNINTDYSCGEDIVYDYSRTTLNLPPSLVGKPIYYYSEREQYERQRVVVNGHLAQVPPGHFDPSEALKPGPNQISLKETPEFLEIGRWLKPGPNSIAVALATTCVSEPTKARFFAGDRERFVEASLPNEAPIPPLWPRGDSSSAKSQDASDDWLRHRRDGRNTAHSTTPIRLPLHQAWKRELNAADARIYQSVALILDNRGTLFGIDLKTGAIRWRRDDVALLGDLSENGDAAVYVGASPVKRVYGRPSGDKMVVVDAATGEERWSRDLPGLIGAPSIHDGILYLYDNEGGLLRLRATDGKNAAPPIPASEMSILDTKLQAPELSPPPATEMTWGDQIAFSEDQIIYGIDYVLFARRIEDPRHGTNDYNGGWVWPIVSGPFGLSEGWYYTGAAFLRDGDSLRTLWRDHTGRGTAHCWVPLGSFGAVLLMKIRDDGLDELNLYDLPTGKRLWSKLDVTVEGEALSAGDEIISEESLPVLPKWEAFISAKPRTRRYLVVRDAKTGDIRWKSAAYAGTPLAAAHGTLLVESDGLLRGFR